MMTMMMPPICWVLLAVHKYTAGTSLHGPSKTTAAVGRLSKSTLLSAGVPRQPSTAKGPNDRGLGIVLNMAPASTHLLL